MFSIGDFARLGLVSVRMLRHYDAIGLLLPARTDPATGYRWYTADQLARLNRIVALKELGFTLAQVEQLLDERVEVGHLRGMLRLRRAQLETQVAADTARLLDVETRLRVIEREGQMPEYEIIVKQVAETTVAELTGVAASYRFGDINPVIGPLYASAFTQLVAAGLTPSGPQIGYYEDIDDGVRVHAAIPVTGAPTGETELTLVRLPALAAAATLVHRGELAGIGSAFDAIAHWITENGYTGGGYAREVYLQKSADELSADWVVELQVPVLPR